jgi:hypothetical protein
MLDLVNPAATFGRLLGRAEKTRLDEDCRVGQRTLTQHGRLIAGTAPESSQDRLSSSGSLAMLAAMRRASSLVSSLAAARRPGSSSK